MLLPKLLLKRLIEAIPTLLVLSLLLFVGLAALPGDATLSTLGETATPAQRAVLRAELGLDRPVPLQYLSWLGHLLEGDFGRSTRTREPVASLLATRLPVTGELALLSILLASAVGIPLGVVSATRRDTKLDGAIRVLSIAGLSVPYFWVGILLILAFSVGLGWLPPSGYVSPLVSPGENLRLMLMPASTIALSMVGLITRQTRAAMLEVLREDYVRTAHAKGLSPLRVALVHVLRNALIPIVTVLSLQLGHLIGGAVVTETIFSLPGIGRMVVEAIFERDFTVLQGAVVTIIVAVIVINLATDLAYTVIDKRTVM